MNGLLRRIEVARYWLGAPGQAGLLLVMLCLLAYALLLWPTQQRVQRQGAELAWLHSQPRQQARPVAAYSDAQALAGFYRQFPAQAELAGLLRQLHQLAQDSGIVLVAGEYKLSRDNSDRALQRYEIVLPVTASYRQLREFVAQAALRFPTLGLSEVSVKREAIGEDKAEVKLLYVLLLRGTP